MMTNNRTRNTTRDYKANVIRVMQINLNHAKAAQDLFNQWTTENKIELAAVQEPYCTDNKDYWFTSIKGLTAIY